MKNHLHLLLFFFYDLNFGLFSLYYVEFFVRRTYSTPKRNGIVESLINMEIYDQIYIECFITYGIYFNAVQRI